MRYISTRGQSPAASFVEVLLGGPAPDGGLYLPETWPQFSREQISAFGKQRYAEAALAIMQPFIGDAFSAAEFRADVEGAYAAFAHPDVAPLVELGRGRYLLELFHGPTIAFKDVAMQLL